jgi:hypothetical protein
VLGFYGLPKVSQTHVIMALSGTSTVFRDLCEFYPTIADFTVNISYLYSKD